MTYGFSQVFLSVFLRIEILAFVLKYFYLEDHSYYFFLLIILLFDYRLNDHLPLNVDASNGHFESHLVFSVFYDKIIKDWFIRKCNKILNLHNAPLPKYRGVQPINWALKNNEDKHGVTIHEITPGIDDGPIISQLEYSIYPYFDEVRDVYERALNYSWMLFEQTIPILDKIIPKEQDDSAATYYSRKQSNRLEERQNFTKESSQ